MSVNLTMDGNTYEDAKKITVGGKTIDIAEILAGDGTAPTFEQIGTYTSPATGTVYPSNHIFTNYTPSYPAGMFLFTDPNLIDSNESTNGCRTYIAIYTQSKVLHIFKGFRLNYNGVNIGTSVTTLEDAANKESDKWSGNIAATGGEYTLYEADLSSGAAFAESLINAVALMSDGIA